MIIGIVSCLKSTLCKLLTGSICEDSINTILGSKNLVNPSGMEARRVILRFYPTPVYICAQRSDKIVRSSD